MRLVVQGVLLWTLLYGLVVCGSSQCDASSGQCAEPVDADGYSSSLLMCRCKEPSSLSNLTVHLVADNVADAYADGEHLATAPRFNKEVVFWFLARPCGEMWLRVTNLNTSTCGISMYMEGSRGGRWGVGGEGEYAVAGTGYLPSWTKPGVYTAGDDYTSGGWRESVVVTGLLNEDNPKLFMDYAAVGAPPMGWEPKRVPAGEYAFVVRLPGCPAS